MATQHSKSSLATFDELENWFSTCKVNVRLLHSWEARNPKKNNSLMGLELLLLDEKVFIPASRIGLFEHLLKPHGVYVIQDFIVVKNKEKYKVSDHKFMLHFTDQTVCVEVKEESSIALEKFWFRTFEEFDAKADVNEDLYDALGQIVRTNDEQTNLDSMKGRLEIHLQLKDGTVVRVTFWTSIAKKFRDALAALPATPKVLIVTAINPRRLGGLLYLNSTSATRFFFDAETEASAEYLTWLNDNKKVGVVDFPPSEVTKLETVTLTELQAFMATNTPQRAGFICEAKIVDILPDYGWNYVACTKCTCKLTRTATTLVCKHCDNLNVVGIIRYRVELSVQDNHNKTATFVVFDRDATQLTGKKAADIVEIDEQDANGVVGPNYGAIPQCLLDLIGKTFTFQIKVTKYNFTAPRQTLTVSRILTSPKNESSESDFLPPDDIVITGSSKGNCSDKKMGREFQQQEDLEAKKNGKRVKYD